MFYLLAPVYKFSEPVHFSGKNLYNPYKDIDSADWKIYNFQVQSKAWGGITDGRKNSNELIDSIYTNLGFDHVATSDYQKINYYGSNEQSFIPTYEHGYNIFKTHQVCIGAEKVIWTDLFLWQSKSMKQWIIDELNKSVEFIVLAHPLLRNGYTVNDFKYLTNYDGIEVLNNIRVSVEHWDTALSSGQPAWIIGNDDAHDVSNWREVGRRFTMINSPNTDSSNIINSLKTGASYGMDILGVVSDTSFEQTAERIKNLPLLTEASLIQDTFNVRTSTQFKEVRFISDGGKIVSFVTNSETGTYKIKPENSYLRTEIEFFDGSVMYLNPVVRTNGDEPVSMKTAEVDTSATLKLRMVYFIIGLIIAYSIAKWRKNKKAVKGNV